MNKRFKPSKKGNIISVSILLLVTWAFIFYTIVLDKWISFGGVEDLTSSQKTSLTTWIIGATLVIIGVSIYFYRGLYYEFSDSSFLFHHQGKDDVVKYEDVIYLDKEYSLKKNSLCFITKSGKAYSWTLDKKKEMVDYLLKRCFFTLSKEEMKETYPNITLFDSQEKNKK